MSNRKGKMLPPPPPPPSNFTFPSSTSTPVSSSSSTSPISTSSIRSPDPPKTKMKSKVEDLKDYLGKFIPISQIFYAFQTKENTLEQILGEMTNSSDLALLLDTYDACQKFSQLILQDETTFKQLKLTRSELFDGFKGELTYKNMAGIEKLLSLNSSIFLPLRNNGGDTGDKNNILPLSISKASDNPWKVEKIRKQSQDKTRFTMFSDSLAKFMMLRNSRDNNVQQIYDVVCKNDPEVRRILLALNLSVSLELESTVQVQLNEKQRKEKPGHVIKPDINYLIDILTTDSTVFLPLFYCFENADKVEEFYSSQLKEALMSLGSWLEGEVILDSYTCPLISPYKIWMRLTLQKDNEEQSVFEMHWAYKVMNTDKASANSRPINFRYLSSTHVKYFANKSNNLSSSKTPHHPFKVISCNVKALSHKDLIHNKSSREEVMKKIVSNSTSQDGSAQTSDFNVLKLTKLPESFKLVEEFSDTQCHSCNTSCDQ